MPDLEKIIRGLETLFQLIFSEQVPVWIWQFIGGLLLLYLLLLGISRLLDLLSTIRTRWSEDVWPYLHDVNERRRSIDRCRFADHIEGELRRLNNLEEWSDYRFAELEAEVEAEATRRVFGLLPFRRTRTGLRREKSLSRALARSEDRLILLEGEPGSGKSVALRHVAQKLARKAMRARSTHSLP